MLPEMKELKQKIEILESKYMIYFNELGDEFRAKELRNEILKANERYLDLMALDDQCEAFERMINAVIE